MYKIRTADPRGSHSRKMSTQVQLPSFRFPHPSVYGKTDIPQEISSEVSDMQMQALPTAEVSAVQEEAEDYIKYIKNLHSDATHNCSAYKINNNGLEFFKVDDDGEPSGTAGKPMGDIINYMGVTNLVVVATRYFG